MRPPPAAPTSSPIAAPSSVRPAPPNQELEQTKRVLATKVAELRALQTERETWIARMAERDSRILELESETAVELPRLRTRVVDLESELLVVKADFSRSQQLDAEAAALRAQARRLEATLAERDALVSVVETALAEREARVVELENAVALERTRAGRREARVSELEAELESLAWSAAPADDLTRIKGIGPKFREALLAAGFSSFSQIAAWNEVDVTTVAATLRVQPARIAREGWVESARLLAQGQRSG